MEEFVWAVLTSKDRYGTSAIEVEDLEYEQARERIIGHLEYVYRSRRFADLTLEIKDRTKKITRSLEKVDHNTAKDGIIEFLKYVYKVSGEIPEMEPMKTTDLYEDRSWLGKYDLDDLTQMEKVFLLLKHNHETGWVKSQDLKEEYEIMYGERIKLSSLSTYLARLYEKGSLERKGSRAQRVYRMSGVGVKANPT
jgi:hypothetical protein